MVEMTKQLKGEWWVIMKSKSLQFIMGFLMFLISMLSTIPGEVYGSESGTLQLSSPTYSLGENGRTVKIIVTRTGGSTGAASVRYATANGTATAGSDYTAKTGTLNWISGNVATKTFTVTILNDGVSESSEAFAVNLSGATGAAMGSPASSTVTITDDDTGGLTQLKVSANGRYLTDQSGEPFLIQGDTPWRMFVGLTQAEAIQYLDNRAAKKFNAIQAMLLWGLNLESLTIANRNGDLPFTAKISGTNYWDFTKPNAAYFASCDQMINAAAARGIYVFMPVAWVGYSGADWYNTVIANGTTRCQTYGQYLGNRYKDFPNIVWIMQGDKNPNGGEMDEERAIANGIKTYATHLITAHCQRYSSARDWFNGESWLTLNSTYTNWDVVSDALLDYNRSPAMPSYLIEAWYEETPRGMTPIDLRRQSYWALFCGLTGQMFGHHIIFQFADGWQTAMNSTGSTEQTHVKSLMDSRAWFNMVPDQTNSVVTNGGGTFPAIIRATRASNGETVMVYLPGGQTPTVVMSKVSGSSAKCWWYNTRTGGSTLIGTYSTTGTRNFTTPDGNDWVLVLDDTSKGFPAPGTSVY